MPHKLMDKQVPVHITYLDFQKAFHKTLHQSILRTPSGLKAGEKYEPSRLTGEEGHQGRSIFSVFSITSSCSTCTVEEGSLLVRNCFLYALSRF